MPIFAYTFIFLQPCPVSCRCPQSGITNAQLPDWLTNKQRNKSWYIRQKNRFNSWSQNCYFLYNLGAWERKLEVMLWQFLTAKFIFYRIESKRKPNWCGVGERPAQCVVIRRKQATMPEGKNYCSQICFLCVEAYLIFAFWYFKVLRTCVLLLLLLFFSFPTSSWFTVPFSLY